MTRKTSQLFLIITLVIISGFLILTIKNQKKPEGVNSQTVTWYMLLLENRLSYIQLTKLDPLDARFYDEYAQLRTKVRDSLTAIHDYINKNTEKTAKSEGIVARQLELLDMIDASESALTQIFQYDPRIDLNNIDMRENTLVLLEKSLSASNGLQSITNKLPMDTEIAAQIAKTNELLNTFSNSLQRQEFTKATTVLTQVIDQFDVLKQTAYNEQLTIIRSDESVAMLVDLTKELMTAKNILETTESE